MRNFAVHASQVLSVKCGPATVFEQHTAYRQTEVCCVHTPGKWSGFSMHVQYSSSTPSHGGFAMRALLQVWWSMWGWLVGVCLAAPRPRCGAPTNPKATTPASTFKINSYLDEAAKKSVLTRCASAEKQPLLFFYVLNWLNKNHPTQPDASVQGCSKSLTPWFVPPLSRFFLFRRPFVYPQTTRKQTVLYNLFEWPSRRNARLVVVGIANTIDLPERCLPRVSSRVTSRLTFGPYHKQQVRV